MMEKTREKWGYKKWGYIRNGLVVLLVLFVILDLWGGRGGDADMETLVAEVTKAAGMEGGRPAGARMVKRFYGLNPGDYESVVLYAPADNMDARELLIVKLATPSQREEVEKAVQGRLDVQLDSFDGYGAEQTALLEAHVLRAKGDYVLYVVHERADEAGAAFEKAFR
jgi:hypothetical protein